MSQVIIVGAGIAGCALAILLAEQHNMRVSVYEKRPSMSHLQVQNGKSINMLLSPRGAKTLHRCGVLPEIRKRFPKIYGRMIHMMNPEEKPSFFPYSVRKTDGWFNTSVARNEIIEVLVNKARALGVMFYFGYELIALDVRSERVYCRLLNEGRMHSVSCDLVVGADGLYSAVRSRLPISTTRSITNYCYKELTIGPNADGKFAISPNAIHVFPRGRYFMIALPNEHKTFGCTLVLPEEDAQMLSKMSNEQTKDFLRENFPDIYPFMTNIDSFISSTPNPLWDVSCSDYDFKGRVALIGDAAHTILPFLGQGMNLALEDSLVLSDLIKRFGDFPTALSEFTRLRKPDADAIQRLSESNFRELSRNVQSKSFQMRKNAELTLHKILPDIFAPSPFILANFAGLPYEKVREKVQSSERLIDEMIWYSKMFGVAVGTLLTGSVVKAKL